MYWRQNGNGGSNPEVMISAMYEGQTRKSKEALHRLLSSCVRWPPIWPLYYEGQSRKSNEALYRLHDSWCVRLLIA